jgi:hypothetical protein
LHIAWSLQNQGAAWKNKGMKNILHKFTLDSMHQIDPKESDNPGREGEVGC